MTLALAFGRTLAELESTLSGDELRWWKAYNRISPIGQQRDDALMAISTARIAGIKKVEDCLPRWFKPLPLGMPRTRAGLSAAIAKIEALSAEGK